MSDDDFDDVSDYSFDEEDFEPDEPEPSKEKNAGGKGKATPQKPKARGAF